MDDAAALAGARGGDSEAFRALVQRHSRPLFRLAFRLTGSEADAEDVVQETFLRAFVRLGQFEERAAVGSWLYRIAANASYDVLRARRRREATWGAGDAEEEAAEAPSEAPGPERLAFSAELKGRVERVMARMSAAERASFVLRHFEGRSIREIGAELGQSENSAKQSLLRAVRKLRAALERVGVEA
jgi:RNA polymerase sigma-70 factor (ECF subfamily)